MPSESRQKSKQHCFHKSEGLGPLKSHLVQGVGGGCLLFTDGQLSLSEAPRRAGLSVFAHTPPRSPDWGCWGEGSPGTGRAPRFPEAAGGTGGRELSPAPRSSLSPWGSGSAFSSA